MAPKVPRFREIQVIETLIHQGIPVTCYRCGDPFTLEDVRTGNIEREHLHETGLDGPNIPENCRYSHAGKPCHAKITHGNGATFAGSSRHKVAKATDPERIEKFVVKKSGPKPRERKLDADRVSLPSPRCRRCGGPPGECSCSKPERRSAWQGRR